MQFLMFTLFEIGQFLRILLWIALPIIMVSIFVAVYIQHRKKTKQGYGGGQYWVLSSSDEVVPEQAAVKEHAEELGVEGETVYQGLLWLKTRYEQDREQSTAKYMQLKEEHGQLKEKYLQLETRHVYTQELLTERQTTIDRLREQLEQEILRTAEVKGKLESSGHLLLKIHRELDQVVTSARSAEGDTDAAQPAVQPAAESTRITAWIESESESEAMA